MLPRWRASRPRLRRSRVSWILLELERSAVEESYLCRVRIGCTCLGLVCAAALSTTRAVVVASSAAERAQLVRVEELHGDRRRRVTGQGEGHHGDAAVRGVLA